MSLFASNQTLGPNLSAQTTQDTVATLSANKSKGSDLASKATEFEAILLGQWLQGSESAFGSVPGGEEDDDPGADQMKSFAFQHLASSLAEMGGIGIATMMRSALAKDGSEAPLLSESHRGPASNTSSGTVSKSSLAVEESAAQQAILLKHTVSRDLKTSKIAEAKRGQ